jgi:hypothetical protein
MANIPRGPGKQQILRLRLRMTSHFHTFGTLPQDKMSKCA